MKLFLRFELLHNLAILALAALIVLLLSGCAPQAAATESAPVAATQVDVSGPGAEVLPPTAAPAASPYPSGEGWAAVTPAEQAYPGSDAAEATPAAQAYPGPDSAATPAAPADPKPAPPSDLPADAALRLSRSGGIAGITETWTVYADGRVEVSRKAAAAAEPVGQLQPAQVQALLAQLEQLGFFEMQTEYGKNVCCDMIVTTLQARSGERQHHVTVVEGQEGIPAEALAAVQAVQALLQGFK